MCYRLLMALKLVPFDMLTGRYLTVFSPTYHTGAHIELRLNDPTPRTLRFARLDPRTNHPYLVDDDGVEYKMFLTDFERLLANPAHYGPAGTFPGVWQFRKVGQHIALNHLGLAQE